MMPSSTYRIIGRVANYLTHEGLDGIKVEAWVKAQVTTPSKLLKETETAEEGLFQIGFEKSDLDKLALPGKVIVFFKLYHNGDLIKSTESSVLLIPGPGEHTINDLHVAVSPIPPDTYQIIGRVISEDPDQTVAGIKVQALGKASPKSEGKPVTATQTAKTGKFLIEFKKSELDGLGLPHDLLIYFHLSQNSELLTSTEDSAIHMDGPGKHDAGEIKIEKRNKVYGYVLWPDGKPFTGTEVIDERNEEDQVPQVSAFNKLIREEVLLGSAEIDDKGYYEISYIPRIISPLEKDRPNIIIRAYDQNEEEVAATDVIYNVKPTEKIDLTVTIEGYRGPSQYERLVEELTPSLEGLTFAELTNEDITYLNNDIGIERPRIVGISQAEKLAMTIDHPDLPTEVFYGFARKGLSLESPKALLSRPLPVLKQALGEAIEENILPYSSKEQLGGIVAALQACMVHEASVAPEPGGVTFTALLETCGSLDSEKRDRFLEFLASYRGGVENLWAELEQDTEFSPQEVEDIRFTLQFSTLSRNHLPMVTAMQTLREMPLPGFSKQPIQEIRELARFKAEDWLGLILDESNDPPIGFPPDTPGADDDEKAHNYAEHLFRQVEAAFPTAAVAYQLKDADTTVWNWGPQLSEFLLEYPDFDLKTTRIEPYLKQLPRRLRSSDNENEDTEIKEELKTLQRLFQVIPRFDHIQTLRQAGFNSARSVARFTRESFVERHGADFGGNEVANGLHETASDRMVSATLVWTEWAQQFEQAQPEMIPGKPTPPPDFIEEQIPNWTELFGSPDYCTCKHCRSIYSPAAYFVELLQFLENESTYQSEETSGPDSSYTNGFDLLLSRRPDLEHIELTCANTNTPLPYVDLVNEILERAVVEAELGTNWPQTTWSAEELAANPEHVEQSAYEDILNDAIYPWILPFDLYAEEARIYLKHLGVPRWRLMEVFFRDSAPPGAAYLDLAIAREYLGLTETEWQLVAGEETPHWAALWGLAAIDNEIANPYDPTGGTINGAWHEVLRHCWILLKRSDLTVDQLKQLLRLQFVNPEGNITIEGEEACRIEELHLHFAADDADPGSSLQARKAFRRLGLFVRLYRQLGWTAPELNQALVTFDQVGPDPENWQVDEDFMMKASHAERLRERLGVPIWEMLCWWGDIPTCREDDDKPSLFETLFLNNSVLPKDESPQYWEDFETLLSNPTPDDPKPITNYLPRLSAALSASVDDILDVLAWAPWSSPEATPDWDRLTLPNLSRLFRVLSLCRVLKLPVREFLALIEMRGQELDPLPPWEEGAEPGPKPTQNLLLLVDDLEKLRGSGFQVAELDYLLRHRFQSPETEEADLRETILVLEQLRAGLQKIDLELNEAEGRRFIKQQLIQVLKLEPAITERLLGPSSDEAPEEENEPLPDAWVKAAETDRDSIEVFLDDVFLESDTLIKETFADQRAVRDSLTEQYGTLVKLKKVATILLRLRLSMKEARYLFESGQSEWLDLSALPFAKTEDSASYTGWARLMDVFELRDRIGATTPDLFDLFDMAAQAAQEEEGEQQLLIDILPKRLGWRSEDFNELVDYFGYPQNIFQDEIPFLRLEACFDLSHRIGVSIKEPVRIIDWSDHNVSPEVARSIKLAVKSKYDEPRWLEVTKPLQDGLRERKRQSLVAYLTGLWDWTPEQLYAYYLIDVDMQACMFTSRIKQALSSVQLFVQRCLLGLEGGVDITAQAARWWNEWMKNYRVWEANRKIFAYPENWIEPELRDDKSPFFEELEKELRQNDITPETAEKAYLNYLEKLNRVSRLEIVAQHYDHESGCHYIFGRTPSTPHVYYFRYRDNCRVWSPWEQIDLDIEADHLIPAVWNRRLYLFWPIFKEVSKKPEATAEGEPFAQASKVWEIKTAWSEYWQGKWGEKKITPVPLRPEGNRATTYYYDPVKFLWSTKRVDEVPVLSDEDISQFTANREGIGSTTTFDLSISPQPYFGDSKNSSLFYLQPLLINDRLCLRTFYVRDFALERERYSPTGEFHFTDNTGEPLQREYGSTEDLFLPISGLGYVQGSALHASGGDVCFKAPTGKDLKSEEYEDSGELPARTSSINFWSLPSNGKFQLLFPQSGLLLNRPEFGLPQIGWYLPIVYQDADRTFLIHPTVALYAPTYLYAGDPADQYDVEYHTDLYIENGTLCYQVESHFHPYASLFIDSLHQGSIDGLLKAPDSNPLFRQQINKDIFGSAGEGYSDIHEQIIEPYPKEEITFEDEEAYALYNWELFFHIPLLIADRLSTNQQFEAAQKWFHYIFDPTDVIPKDDPRWGAWRFGRFLECQDTEEPEKCFERLMGMLNRSDPEFADRVTRWRNNPFQPHLIARLRDGGPYMKTVVMKYIDNLMAWGDALFRRDTIESINEATQLYILAASILGPRPQQLPELERAGQTYAMLKDRLDAFGNALVPVENELVQAGESEFSTASLKLLPHVFSYELVLNPDLWIQPAGVEMAVQNMAVGGRAMALAAHGGAAFQQEMREDLSVGYQPAAEIGTAIPMPMTLYFCIPANDKLLGYWETVADRLFKIRHCMNIEGIVRELPLFEPPIEPGLLVKAAAAGIDLGSIVSEMSPGLPHYRFGVMLQKALELCADVRTLGGALLAALEKCDAEELSLLRSTHERRVLDALTEIREQQVEEAQAAMRGLERAKESAELQRDHYASQEFMIPAEKQQLDLMTGSMMSQQVGQFLQLAASLARRTPDFTGGYCSLGGAGMASYGGSNEAGGLEASAWYANSIASMLNTAATQSSILGSYRRRKEDWDLKKRTAAIEAKRITEQITAAEIGLAIAQRNRENHVLQTKQAKEIEEHLRSKFSNQELYDWMVAQLSTLYFQSYQLAYDLAKRAERCYRFELGLTGESASFIQFGYWDNLKKGLLSGDKLHFDLKRMETAYLEQNSRGYELTKHVSLALLAPEELLRLKETGTCEITLPESLFDMDFPGHYLRRIKNVSISIPCVAGPYIGVNATLTLVSDSTRLNSDTTNGYARVDSSGEPDARFKDDWVIEQSIATSHAQNDSGVFELNFRDERYFPFEGAGVIDSEWRIELSGKWETKSGVIQEFPQFDFDTISDVILHLNYTARNGGETLKEKAIAEVIAHLPKTGLVRMLSARHDFPNEWHSFLDSAPTEEKKAFKLTLTPERFPYVYRQNKIVFNSIGLFLGLSEGTDYDDARPLHFEFVQEPTETEETEEFEFKAKDSPVTDIPYAKVLAEANEEMGEEYIRYIAVAPEADLQNVQDIFFVFTYSVDEK